MHESPVNFPQDNEVIRLCALGMEAEGQGHPSKARGLFNKAWALAATDVEKFTAAHYVARHQQTVTEKLLWDEKAVQHALQADNEAAKAALPSLYLNVGKCFEDLNERETAKSNYQAALSFLSFLPADGYGDLIRTGIENGLDRLAKTALSDQ